MALPYQISKCSIRSNPVADVMEDQTRTVEINENGFTVLVNPDKPVIELVSVFLTISAFCESGC